MKLRSLDQRLAPGIGAAFAGFAASVVWSDATTTIVSAVVGATAMALIFARPESDGLEAPRHLPERSPATQPPRPDTGLAPGEGRALLERLPLGIILIDGRGQILFANEQAEHVFGRTLLADQHGSSLRIPKIVEAIDSCVTHGHSNSVEFAMSRDADIRLRAHVMALTEPGDPDGAKAAPRVMLVMEDVTQMHKAVDLHRDFVANASHELKTPLSSITGIIQTLQGHAKGDATATERFLDMMAAQTDRMKRLVEDLLSLNRIELNERIPPRDRLPVRRIVWEVADALTSVAEDNDVTLEVDQASDLPHVLGNREELAQVFRNLIENAIKYGRPGTPVTVSVEAPSDARAEMIGISICDHGPGIAREHIPRLTERFYRVSVSRSREKGGTGLGLAIVKHILNRHRGELEIRSEVGAGSTFTVWLPLTDIEPVEESRPADAA
ncbi:MAG: ATP-binding protein [Pseudomonadota bacterium]